MRVEQELLEWLHTEMAAAKKIVQNKAYDDDVRTHQYGRLSTLYDIQNKLGQLCPDITLPTYFSTSIQDKLCEQ